MLDALGEPLPVGGVHVVVGDAETDGFVGRDAKDVRGALVDGEDGVVAQATDYRSDRADSKQLEEERMAGRRRSARWRAFVRHRNLLSQDVVQKRHGLRPDRSGAFGVE